MSGSIRQRAETQRDRHHASVAASINGHACCQYCNKLHPCPDWVAADDTITDLNNAAEGVYVDSTRRFGTFAVRTRTIFDPERDDERREACGHPAPCNCADDVLDGVWE